MGMKGVSPGYFFYPNGEVYTVRNPSSFQENFMAYQFGWFYLLLILGFPKVPETTNSNISLSILVTFYGEWRECLPAKKSMCFLSRVTLHGSEGSFADYIYFEFWHFPKSSQNSKTKEENFGILMILISFYLIHLNSVLLTNTYLFHKQTAKTKRCESANERCK